MLYALMQECRNYFEVPGAAMEGTFVIEGGVIGGLDLPSGQYYIVDGSIFNDGLHRESEDLLQGETFTGRVIPLAVPKAFQELAERVNEWRGKYGEMSPIVAESFAGYSYQKTVGKTGGQLTWKEAFAEDLERWRKI